MWFKVIIFSLITFLAVNEGDCGFFANRRCARQERRSNGFGVFSRARCASTQSVEKTTWKSAGQSPVTDAKVCYCENIDTCDCTTKGVICIDRNGRSKVIN